MDELSMRAYYYSFDKTGIRVIDEILSCIAYAGKAHHNTSEWDASVSFDDDEGPSFIDLIQSAAYRAAKHIREIEGE